MKTKSVLTGLILIAVYTFIVWPEKPADSGSEINNQKVSKRAVSAARQPDREVHKKVVKSIPHKKSADPSVLRLDPNVKMDHTHKHEQVDIEASGYGTFPPVKLDDLDSNPQKKYVYESLKDPKNNSGAVSIVGKREKFNPENYKSNPEKYLNSAEPGRAFDAAQAGEGVKRIQREGYSSIQARQNEVVTLTAKGEKGMPVSFTAFDGGKFQNGLSFITLKADAGGIASAEFTPTEGVINQARIRAASPVNSGTLQWTVFVRKADKQVSNN